MHRDKKKKIKFYSVIMAMLFLAVQITLIFQEWKAVSAETSYYTKEQILVPEIKVVKQEESNEEEIPAMNKRNLRPEDKEILLQIAMAEAESEGVDGKAYVMMVVINRTLSEEFPETVEEVVFQEGQFITTEDGCRYWNVVPDAECYEAYEMVLNGWDESEGALYFCTDANSSWMDENTEYLYTVGNHNFYK